MIPPKGPRPAAAPEAAARDPETAALDPRLVELGRLVDKFRVDAERYFNGAIPVPPEDLRLAVQRAFRDLRNAQLRSAVEQFRLSGLEARFNVLSETYGRRLRDREEGRGPPRAPGAAAAAEPKRYDPEQGVVLGRSADPEAVEALFAGLARGGAAGRLDLDSFRNYLARQADEIRSKTGAEQVQFRLAREDGKIKLKARPVGGAGRRS